MYEIERKWLLNELPVPMDNKKSIGYELYQGYLCTNPEIRIRSKREKVAGSKINHKITYKSNGKLKRIEIQFNIPSWLFRFLSLGLNREFIHKHYLKLFDGDKIYEMSCVDNGEFYYAEIEFESEELANQFIAPKWFGREVTNDDSWKMKNYWLRKPKIR